MAFLEVDKLIAELELPIVRTVNCFSRIGELNHGPNPCLGPIPTTSLTTKKIKISNSLCSENEELAELEKDIIFYGLLDSDHVDVMQENFLNIKKKNVAKNSETIYWRKEHRSVYRTRQVRIKFERRLIRRRNLKSIIL